MATWTGPDFLWYQRNALLTEGKGARPAICCLVLALCGLGYRVQFSVRSVDSDFLTYASLLGRYIYLSGNIYTSQKSV